MNKAIAPVIASILIFSTFTFISPIDGAYAKSNKVTICHIPPGNPENAHTITVSENAVEAHLAHGDFIGTCESGPDCVNYPDQEDCERESILLVHAFLVWSEFPPASGAICYISPFGSLEPIIMEFVLDADGNAEIHIPSEFTQVQVSCLAQFVRYEFFGTGGAILDPEEPTSVFLALRAQNV